jgi:hypothetical protein
MPNRILVALLIIICAVGGNASFYRFKRQSSCSSCTLTFSCTDWEDFVDGVVTYSASTDANGCATVTMSCGEEAGLTPQAPYSYLYAGTYLMDDGTNTVTCNSNGIWLEESDVQTFTCAVYRDPSDPTPPPSSPTCKTATTPTTVATTTPIATTTEEPTTTAEEATTTDAATTTEQMTTTEEEMTTTQEDLTTTDGKPTGTFINITFL